MLLENGQTPRFEIPHALILSNQNSSFTLIGALFCLQLLQYFVAEKVRFLLFFLQYLAVEAVHLIFEFFRWSS